MRPQRGKATQNAAKIMLSMQGIQLDDNVLLSSLDKSKTQLENEPQNPIEEVRPMKNLKRVLRKRTARMYVEVDRSDDKVVDDQLMESNLEAGGSGSTIGSGVLTNCSELAEFSFDGVKEVPASGPHSLAGLNFVIDGKLDSLGGKEAKYLIMRHGGRLAGCISKETNYLLVEENIGGWKFSEDMGISFLTMDGLFDMIRKSELTKAAPPMGSKGSPSEVESQETAIDAVKNQDWETSFTNDINTCPPEIMQGLQNCIGREEALSQDSDQPVQPPRLSDNKKRKRGKTVAKETNTRVIVEFNEKGKPIRSNSAAYSSYLGVIGREVVPIIISDWREVPLALKEKLWAMVKKKFVVPEHVKEVALKLIGKSWREYKARLRTTFYDSHDNDEARIANCPEEVELEDWKIFVASISCPDYVMKAVRKHHKFPQTSSRKGYDRLEDEMKSNIDDPSSITWDAVWTRGHTKKSGEPVNDLAKEKIDKINKRYPPIPCSKNGYTRQVLGRDNRASVREVGIGIPPTVLSVSELSCLKMHILNLEEEMKALRKEVPSMDAMRKEISALKNLVARFIESQKNQLLDSDDDPTRMQGKRSSKLSSSRTLVKCKLFRLIPEDVVAHGYWYSDDPMTTVQQEPIGPGMSKIYVTEAVQWDALLIKRTDELQTIGDAVARHVVWPTSSVIKET